MNKFIVYKERLILFFFFVLYSVSIGTDPILGDSLAYTVEATYGYQFASNATNHLLYINFLAFLNEIFPLVNPHLLYVFVSILCSILTLYFFRKLLRIFIIKEINIDVVILLLGFSFTFWRISIITEVYSFYILFVLIFLFTCFIYLKKRQELLFYISTIIFGILFLIHIQTILLVPFYIHFLWKAKLYKTKDLLIGIFIPLFIASILLIPFFQGTNSLVSIFTDNAWGKSFFHFNLVDFYKSFLRNLLFIIYNFMLFILLIFKGFKEIDFKCVFLIVIIPYLIFILKHDVSDSYVFHLVPYIFILILIGKGLDSITLSKIKLLTVFFIPIFYFLCFKVINNFDIGSKINREIGFKGGTRYMFFPALNGNPNINKFIIAYQNNRLKDKKNFEGQYNYAIKWQIISRNYKQKK